MDDQTLAAGDIIAATITKSLPFGVLVEYAGVAGLAKGAEGKPGEQLNLRVIDFDAAENRFSAERA